MKKTYLLKIYFSNGSGCMQTHNITIILYYIVYFKYTDECDNYITTIADLMHFVACEKFHLLFDSYLLFDSLL